VERKRPDSFPLGAPHDVWTVYLSLTLHTVLVPQFISEKFSRFRFYSGDFSVQATIGERAASLAAEGEPRKRAEGSSAESEPRERAAGELRERPADSSAEGGRCATRVSSSA
jgi:hypothetical protein